MELDGVWRVTPADDELRRQAVEPDFDDDAWVPISVPSHWQSHPEFSQSDGPLLYRRRFTFEPPPTGRRRWLTFEGIFYQADIWMDGAYLGDPEGYFIPHSYDITALSGLEADHVVVAEVACAPQRDARARTNLTGVLQPHAQAGSSSGSVNASTWNPGGIWRPVRVHDTGPASLQRLRVVCRDADEYRAHLVLTARIELDAARRVAISTLVDGDVLHHEERQLASGANSVAWSFDVGDPKLWWPHGMGPQTMTDVEVVVETDGTISDRVRRLTGLREVAWDGWTCSVNGSRIFVRGVNLMPTRLALGTATPDQCRRDIELAVESGFNSVRVRGHIAREATYDAADELGVLVMQDFPLVANHSRSVRTAAVSQARSMVDLLGHHPSIVQWSAHDEPDVLGSDTGEVGNRLVSLVRQRLPDWNSLVLDRWVKRSIEEADPTRMVARGSGVLGRSPDGQRSDTHLYIGWYYGLLDDLEALAKQAPGMLRFLSEFGAQAVPDGVEFGGRGRWPNIDWNKLESTLGLQAEVFGRRVPPGDYDSAAEWTHATQLYQAQVLKCHIELLRRLKYRPVGGFSAAWLNDSTPGVSFSLFDIDRNPKLAVAQVAMACQPVVAVAAPMPTRAAPGATVNATLHIVNDDHGGLDGAHLEVALTAPGFERTWAFAGDVAADSVVEVGRLTFEMPTDSATLELRLTGPSCSAVNRYRIAAI